MESNLYFHIKISSSVTVYPIWYKAYPHLGAVSAGSVEPDGIGGHLVTPLGFSETDRTCTPKQEEVPILLVLAQRTLN